MTVVNILLSEVSGTNLKASITKETNGDFTVETFTNGVLVNIKSNFAVQEMAERHAREWFASMKQLNG